MTTAYVPTSYAPTNASNGAAGATTPESQRNAALQIQQSPSASNPYAEAVTHTLNWLQLQAPPVAAAKTIGSSMTVPPPAPMETGGPVLGTSEQSVNLGATPTGYEPGYTGAMQVGSQNPDGSGTPPGTVPSGTTPPGTTPPTTAPTTPTGEPVAPPVDTRGHPTRPPGGPPSTQTNTPDAWIVLKANEAAKTPGFEWLQNDPWAWAAYAAEQQRNGTTGKGPTFAEWAVRNWGGIADHYKFSDMDKGYFYDNVRKTGLDQWARRLRDDLWATGNKEDTQWVTGDIVGKYNDWYAAQAAANKPTLDFWTWAGSVNAPKPPGTQGTNPNLGMGKWTRQQAPTAPTGGGGTGSLDDLIRSLRDQGAYGRDLALRQFRHEAGLSGLNDMGAYNPALGSLIQNNIRDENAAIYEIMNAKDEAERNRLIQKYIADTGANASITSAGIGASSQAYAADVQRMLGLAGLDVDREQNYFSNNLDYQRLMLQYLQMMYGASPDTILGGNPIPGGDTTVT